MSLERPSGRASGLRPRLTALAQGIRARLRQVGPLRAIVIRLRSTRAAPIPVPARMAFADLIKRERGTRRVLEIGPFAWPLLRGDDVAYADVLTADQIRTRAVEIGSDPDGTPEINFVVPPSDLSGIPEQFRAIVSCHVIEHQPNLIGHFQQVSRLLEPGGRYFLIVPDRRYCADHYMPNSSVADLLAAHLEGRTSHVSRTFIEHRALTVHNDPKRHWQGDHGAQFEDFTTRFATAAHDFAAGAFIDMHAWHFDPDGFQSVMRDLYAAKQVPISVTEVWPTRPNDIEFCAILERPHQAH